MEATLRRTLPAFSTLAIVLVLTARAHAEHRRVVTAEVDDVSVETTGYGVSPETRFNLGEPVPLEGVSVIWVDTVIVGLERDPSNPVAPDGTSPGAETGSRSLPGCTIPATRSSQ